MSDLITFFTSFDKLMKEKLVRAFYWLSLILILMMFVARIFDVTWILGFLGDFTRFIVSFLAFLLAIVALRLFAELAIAIFRINDNLSPDGGKGETADIDPLAEMRRAAEDAAKKTREATQKVVNRTKNATENAGDALDDMGDKVEDSLDAAKDKVAEKASDVKDAAEGAVEKAKSTAKKTTSKAKSSAKSTASKTKTAAKKTASRTRKKAADVVEDAKDVLDGDEA